MKLSEIAKRLHCPLHGNTDPMITDLKPIDEAGPHDLTFVSNKKYFAQLPTTRAAAVILPADAPAVSLPSLRTDNPDLAVAQVLGWLYPGYEPPEGSIPRRSSLPSASIGHQAPETNTPDKTLGLAAECGLQNERKRQQGEHAAKITRAIQEIRVVRMGMAGPRKPALDERGGSGNGKNGAPTETVSRPSSQRAGDVPAWGRQPEATPMGNTRAARASTQRCTIIWLR